MRAPPYTAKLAALSSAASWVDLREAFRSLLDWVETDGEREDPFLQVDLISECYRRTTVATCRRLLQAEFSGELIASDFAILSLGGEGRREVTFKFDQDNCAVFARPDPRLPEFMDRLVSRLEWLGLEPCGGGVMASNPAWQGTFEEWERRIRFLLRGEIGPEDVRRATVLLDVDYVFGDISLLVRLTNALKRRFADARMLQRFLAADVLSMPDYLTLFGRLAVETRADRRGLFNFKFACLYPLAGYLRIEAWKHGVTVASSRLRVRELADRGVLSERHAQELTELLRRIIGLRLTQQRRQIAEGRVLSDHFDLALFTAEEKEDLRRCVRTVSRLKKRLTWLHWV